MTVAPMLLPLAALIIHTLLYDEFINITVEHVYNSTLLLSTCITETLTVWLCKAAMWQSLAMASCHMPAGLPAATSCWIAAAPAGLDLNAAVPTTACADTLPRLQASGWLIGAQPPAGQSSRKPSCRQQKAIVEDGKAPSGQLQGNMQQNA
jgi:hypothetical protein